MTLREERVQVERRPVDRPLTEADRADFEERTETVRGTVRRTEIEADDERRAGTTTPTSTPGAPKRDPRAV